LISSLDLIGIIDIVPNATSEVCVRYRSFLARLGRAGLLARVGQAGLLTGVIALAACAAPVAAGAASTPVTPTSLTDCGGNVSADPGAKAAGEPNLLDYRFSCDTGITAYTIIVDQLGDGGGAIDDYNPAPSVFQTDGVTPSPTESITCEGTTPSDGINCNTGTQGAQLSDGYVTDGSVDPIQAYCKHLPTNAKGKLAKPGTAAVPQAVVQVVVTDYTGAEDGPFDLGPVKACPKVANVVPTPKPAKKTKSKSKQQRTRTDSIKERTHR
jgi:hypothetical protein